MEHGVRFVQLYSGALLQQNIDTWDAHSNLIENHTLHAKEVDQPIAALIRDLKQRGMLEDTLVVWHSEFGRDADLAARAGARPQPRRDDGVDGRRGRPRRAVPLGPPTTLGIAPRSRS